MWTYLHKLKRNFTICFRIQFALQILSKNSQLGSQGISIASELCPSTGVSTLQWVFPFLSI